MADLLPDASLVWRTAGGNPTRCGLFNHEVHHQPHPTRRLQVQGAVQAAVVFCSEGAAIVADMAGVVHAFSAKGKLSWRAKLPGGISATPAVHGVKPHVFIGTHTGWVYALDTQHGETLWQQRIATKADPRILSDLLYLPQADAIVLNSWGGRFRALDAASGTERFSWDAGISPYSAAAADRNGVSYCLRAVPNRGVEFVRLTSKGEETVLHRTPEGKRGARRTMVAATPILDEERAVAYCVINQDSGSFVRAWSLASGTLLWSHPLANSVQATPTLRRDGTILVADLAGFVHAIGPDGSARFRYASGCEYLLAGGVCEASGTAYFGDPLGVLHVIDKQGVGKAVFEAKRAIQARPSFGADGSLYLPSSDRVVYVFDSKSA